MKYLTATLAGALCLAFTGCVSYTGITEMGDDLSDKVNQGYAAEAAKAFQSRMKAPPRPVIIQEADGVNLFLSPEAASGHPLCRDVAVRKELMLAFKAQLREKIAGIKDFKLIDEARAPMIDVSAVGDVPPPPQNYRITYNIIAIDLRESAAGGLAAGDVWGQLKARAGKQTNGQKFCDATAKVEIRLFKPNGTDCVFSFTGEGGIRQLVDVYNPVTKELLLGAVHAAVNNAMDAYAAKFGPPIYVTDTCQDGRFARLSVGSRFGIQAGQRVQFYRNKIRESVTGEDEVQMVVVASGVVGGHRAPVEEDAAWVSIDQYNAEARTVFRWTSARILSDTGK